MASMYSSLYEPFPPEVERQVKKSGTALTYIPISEVITRLNKVIGVDKWSFHINSCRRDEHDPEFVTAHVTLVVTIDNASVSRDGIGGQKIKRTKQGDIVDLGDEFKGAVSDALKKAAQTLGIGLYLARSDEAIEMDIEEEAQKAAASVNPEIAKLWDNFLNLSKTLSPEAKTALNEFWVKFSKGKPKPTKTSATTEELEALIAECVRLSFQQDGQGE